MSQQNVVTNYFVTRKRQRGVRQSSKRQKVVGNGGYNETFFEDNLKELNIDGKRKTKVDNTSLSSTVTNANKTRSKRITRSATKKNEKAKPHNYILKDFFSKTIEKQSENQENASSDTENIVGKCSAPIEDVAAVAATGRNNKASTCPDTIKLQDVLMKMKQLEDRGKITKEKLKNKIENVNTVSKDSGNKGALKRDYAYEKFHNLAKADIPSGLVLPYKYKVLQTFFHSVETIVSMLYNRQETATWTKVEKGVRDMLRKKVDKSNLCQIKHVYPDAYLYRQEKGIPTFNDRIKTTDFQLTLEPILKNKEKPKHGICPKLTGTMLVQRKLMFHQQLLEIVKQHHQEFLLKLDPPIKVVDEKLRRWHPQFPIDDIPNIPSSDLPSPPDEGERCSSAKDVLEKSRSNLTKQAVQVLSRVVQKCSNQSDLPTKSCSDTKANNNVSQLSQSPVRTSVVKGISESLLAKIRDKEANLKKRVMLRTDEDVVKLNKLRLLPDLARSLRILFITERKSSLPVDLISNNLAQFTTSIPTQVSMEEHLRLLSDQLPAWLTFMDVRGRAYVRLDKQLPIADVVRQLDYKITEAEKS